MNRYGIVKCLVCNYDNDVLNNTSLNNDTFKRHIKTIPPTHPHQTKENSVGQYNWPYYSEPHVYYPLLLPLAIYAKM